MRLRKINSQINLVHLKKLQTKKRRRGAPPVPKKFTQLRKSCKLTAFRNNPDKWSKKLMNQKKYLAQMGTYPLNKLTRPKKLYRT